MEIRKATLSDCIELTHLRVEMRKERESPCSKDDEKILTEHLLDYFNEMIPHDDFIAYVAVENNEIVATSGLCFYCAPPSFKVPNGKTACIMNMYTKPSYRRKGIAAQLLDCTVKEAISRGCAKVSLNASSMGKAVYQKYGFVDEPGEMVYYTE